MADDGIIQYIKLAIDQASLDKLKKDAEFVGLSVSQKISSVLERTSNGPNPPLENYVRRMRKTFEKGMAGIHTKMLNDIIQPQEAIKAADELARRINTAITNRIEKGPLGKGLKPFARAQIAELARIKSEETRITQGSGDLQFRLREATKPENIAAGLARAKASAQASHVGGLSVDETTRIANEAIRQKNIDETVKAKLAQGPHMVRDKHTGEEYAVHPDIAAAMIREQIEAKQDLRDKQRLRKMNANERRMQLEDAEARIRAHGKSFTPEQEALADAEIRRQKLIADREEAAEIAAVKKAREKVHELNEKALEWQAKESQQALNEAQMRAHKVGTGTVDLDEQRRIDRIQRRLGAASKFMPRRAILDETEFGKGPMQGPNLPTGGLLGPSASSFARGFRAIRQEIAGETTKIADAADKLKKKLADALIPDDGVVSKVRDKIKKMTALYNIPDPVQPNSVQYSILKSQSSNNIDMARRTQVWIKSNQLAATSFTALGRTLAAFGVNVANLSPKVSGLTKSLSALGLGTTAINRLMPTASKMFQSLNASTVQLIKSFGLLYGLQKIVGFMKETVELSNENEVSWTRLAVAIGDFGGRLSDIMPEVTKVFEAQAAMGVSQRKSAETLARLIQITGDYHKSLKGLPVVQDIVASGYMTMEQATRSVGRAMLGDLGNLSRYGIVLDRNKDALDQLKIRFGGELLQRSKTFAGALGIINVQWEQFKISMGDAFKQGVSESGMMSIFIDGLKEMKVWVSQNSVALKVLASGLLAFFGALAGAIFGVVSAFTLLLKISGSFGISVRQLLVSIPSLAKEAWASFALTAMDALGAVAHYLDTVFHTKLKNALAEATVGARERFTKLREDARKETKTKSDEGNEMLSDLWLSTWSSPAIPDAPVGAGIHIRKEHQQRNRDISEGRKLLLSDNTKRQQLGVNKLLEQETIIRERLAEATEEQNKKEVDLLNTELEAIDKARKAREKKDNDRSKAEREYAEMISHLTAVAKTEDAEAAMIAVQKLNKEHEKLVQKRKNLVKASKEWLENENFIKTIEDGITSQLATQDKKYADRVKKLNDMIDNDVDRAEATEQLNQMYVEQNTIFEKNQRIVQSATKDSKLYNDAMNAAIEAKQKMLSIERALTNERELPNAAIDKLEKDLKIATTRVAAERELVRLRDHLEKVARESKTQIGRETAQGQASRITGILGENTVDLRKLGQQITAAETLIKHGRTRMQGLEELRKIEEKIVEDLKAENLTDKEKLDLQAKLVTIQRKIHDAGEPNMNMAEELLDFWTNDLPSAIENVGSTMSDVFETAFIGIMRDSRNLSHALNSIPKGFAMAMLKEISNMAKGKAKENLAWALEETAKGIGYLASGNVAGAGAAFSSAAQHTAAAAAWGLLGGAAGATGISASDAYSNATDFASRNRGSNADEMFRAGPDIYLRIDGVDPRNPRHQQLVGDASREYQERYGGRIILVPGSSGP